jgi:hypothetical protein
MFQPRSPRKGVRRATAAFALTTAVLVLTTGVAAADTSQASAQAAQLDLLDEAVVDTGTVTASNDGINGEVVTGDDAPLISLLGDQDTLTAGVLAQDATANSDGTSAACAGAVGEGGELIIGDDRDCTATAGTSGGVVIDLTDIDEGDLLGDDLDLGDVLDLDGLVDLGTVSADAIFAECTADSDGTTTGDSTLLNARLSGLLGNDELPSDPEADFEVDLDITGTVDLDTVARLVLNEQTSTGNGQLTVTALHLTVLGDVGDDPVVDLRIGTVSCGPNAVTPPIPAIPAEGMPIAASALAVFGGVAWLVVRNRRSAGGSAEG